MDSSIRLDTRSHTGLAAVRSAAKYNERDRSRRDSQTPFKSDTKKLDVQREFSETLQSNLSDIRSMDLATLNEEGEKLSALKEQNPKMHDVLSVTAKANKQILDLLA